MKLYLPEVVQMISYSKIFKASTVSYKDEVKLIIQPPVYGCRDLELIKGDSPQKGLAGEAGYEDSVQKARLEAESILRKAEETAKALEEAARERISLMQQEHEKMLTEKILKAEETGFQEGFSRGLIDGENAVKQEYSSLIEQAQELLHEAHKQKEAIISEAEPFLLELSTAIASQIIKQELKSNPDTILEMIKSHLLRFKEKEFITICVFPGNFDFIQGHRSQLLAVVNGETEIKIIPDHMVPENGCVIRTAFGSVDARIETQMEEIKKVLIEAKRGSSSALVS